tara:strand:- start:370 stop:1668 length:1299 start_codon:yes stop_codon:yes gene_type:complete
MFSKFLKLLKGIIKNYPKKHLLSILTGLVLLVSISFISKANFNSQPAQIDISLEIPLDSLKEEDVQERIEFLINKEAVIKNNDSLYSILKRLGIHENNIFQIINSENSRLLSKIKVDKKIELSINQNNEIVSLNYIKDFKSGVQAQKKEGTYQIKEYQLKTEKFKVFKKVKINDSLYIDGLKQGLPDSVIMDLVYIFGWDIDFNLDIRQGDSYSLIYEEVFVNGEKVIDGDILIAEFSNLGKKHIAIRYKLKSGDSEYFSPNGRNVKKAFLRSPLKFNYISSRYNLKRKHPIFHQIKAHTGVDYAAGKGTPVRATGDGTIVHSSVKGGYGNLVEIKHTEDYSTRYAHLDRISPRITLGKKVRQADIIGYVGRTGTATGYHLHYEFRVNGKHTNPLKVKLPNAKPINSSEKEKYDLHSKIILDELKNYQNLTL